MRHLLVALVTLAVLATAAQSATQAPKPKAKPAVRVVKVTLKEWSIAAVPAKVKAGTLRFDCVNSGEATHALAIVGVKTKTKNLDPGGKASLTVTLKPGTHTLYCPVGHHRHQGMEAKFTVTK